MIDITARDSSGLPMPIAQMGPGYFWARPTSIGLSPNDADALRDGTASEAQHSRAAQLFQHARTALYEAPSNSSFVRPF